MGVFGFPEPDESSMRTYSRHPLEASAEKPSTPSVCAAVFLARSLKVWSVPYSEVAATMPWAWALFELY